MPAGSTTESNEGERGDIETRREEKRTEERRKEKKRKGKG